MPATTTCPACNRGYRCARCGDCPEHCRCKCEECEGLGQVHVPIVPTVYGDTEQVDCPCCVGTGRGFAGDRIPGLTAASWAQPDRMIGIWRSASMAAMGPLRPQECEQFIGMAKQLGDSYECYGISADGPQLIASWFPPEEEEKTA